MGHNLTAYQKKKKQANSPPTRIVKRILVLVVDSLCEVVDDGVWESLVTGGGWSGDMWLVGGGLVSPTVVVIAAVTTAAVDNATAAAVTVDR